LGGNARRSDILRFIETVVIPFDGDECLIWPFGRNGRGYPEITWDGRVEGVHRIVCRIVRGNPSQSGMDAAHSCGNGHLGCVNPRHLSWKSRKSNFGDRRKHGTWPEGESHPSHVLTANDVRAIRGMAMSHTQEEIATQFGIGRQHVSNIIRRKAWSHI
jgi:hypothetical protein